jgi:excisionase family DNA binding protein
MDTGKAARQRRRHKYASERYLTARAVLERPAGMAQHLAQHLAHDVTGASIDSTSDPAPDAQAGRLVGANEAARFLGIHRSTLHQAVKNGVITPDLTTQGGHFRFSRATLDAFAVRIAREPVTTLSELLPELTTTLGAPNGRRALCLKAYERIAHALPDLTVFAVLGLKAHARSLLDLEVVASVGFPDWYLPELIANVERKDYEVKHVLRTLRPRYFEDTSAAEMRASTRSLARRGALHALAIIPLTQDGEARGVLGLGSLHARKFRTPDVAFLQNTADELAIALACHDYMDGAHAQILTSGALMREALRLRIDSCPAEQPAERIAPLVALFREATGADAAYLIAPGVDLAPPSTEVRALMRRVSRRDPIATMRWGTPGAETTAIVTLAPLNTRANLVVAAEWTSEIIRQQEFEALLYVFAAASAIALGLDGSARKAVRASGRRATPAARPTPVASLR